MGRLCISDGKKWTGSAWKDLCKEKSSVLGQSLSYIPLSGRRELLLVFPALVLSATAWLGTVWPLEAGELWSYRYKSPVKVGWDPWTADPETLQCTQACPCPGRMVLLLLQSWPWFPTAWDRSTSWYLYLPPFLSSSFSVHRPCNKTFSVRRKGNSLLHGSYKATDDLHLGGTAAAFHQPGNVA